MTKDRDVPAIGHPIQREDHDLSQDPRELRRDGKDAPKLSDGVQVGIRSPAAMMREMGFSPTSNMTPLQFLVAVYNDDLEKVFKNEKRRTRMEGKGGIALNYRIECAKTAAKYLHMEMPKVTIADDAGGFGESLSKAITDGTERVRVRETIIQTVERISPDVPLEPASYPDAFSNEAQREEFADIDAEGDTDYDPDTE